MWKVSLISACHPSQPAPKEEVTHWSNNDKWRMTNDNGK
jgi:hypothetical protein